MGSTRKTDPPDAVRAALSETLNAADVEVTSYRTVAAPGGALLHVVSGSAAAKPNQATTLVVDETGGSESLADAEARLGRRLIVADVGAAVAATLRSLKAPVVIDPPSNEWKLSECAHEEERLTVTIPENGATPRADVYLLSDTTGSMFDLIDAVKLGIGAIVGNPALAGFDVAYGVGNYRDFPVGDLNAYAFQHQLAPTTDTVQVSAAVATWNADQGSDIPEGQLWALEQLATDPAIGWRTDAKRIVVWFGDAPGHDPVCAAISGAAADVTEATATAALAAAEITVVAVSTTSGVGAALDDDPASGAFDYGACAVGGTAGQAARITAATGGSHTVGVDATTIVTTLATLIAAAVTTTGNVSLVPSASISDFVESVSPPGGYGPLPGDVSHSLGFDVVWHGAYECTDEDQVFTGSLDVVADGVVVASKPVTITVPRCRWHHPAEMLCGTEERSDERCITVLPGRYATAVTIYNPTACTVTVEKFFAPLVHEGEAIGREPRTVPARRFAKIELGPHEATMDDCCSLEEAVRGGGGGPLLLGVLDVVADTELVVTAIYTAGGEERSGPAIATRRVRPYRS